MEKKLEIPLYNIFKAFVLFCKWSFIDCITFTAVTITKLFRFEIVKA
jgi:hypothetical protein